MVRAREPGRRVRTAAFVRKYKTIINSTPIEVYCTLHVGLRALNRHIILRMVGTDLLPCAS